VDLFSTISDLNIFQITEGKKIFFASDFHLGSPNEETSLIREKKIVRWLDEISSEAYMIFLVGDIFDFWFEYKKAIPRGFIRFQGKLAELKDKNIPIYFFTGNHDMWMFDYFTNELDIPVFRQPIQFKFNNQLFLIGHGDGLGPGDHKYKFLKKFFASKLCQWLFARIHPNLGIGLAHFWSRGTRIHKLKHEDETFKGDDEWIWIYCKEIEKKIHHDYYIFGHRHLPLNLPVGEKSKYINLGEWFTQFTYASFDGQNMTLNKYEG